MRETEAPPWLSRTDRDAHPQSHLPASESGSRKKQSDFLSQDVGLAILGHVSSATTLNTYSHVTDEMRQRAAIKIDRCIAKAEVKPQTEKPRERTMTTYQARKRWTRKAG